VDILLLDKRILLFLLVLQILQQLVSFNSIGTVFTANGVGTGTGTALIVFGNIISGQLYYVASVAGANSFSIKRVKSNSSILNL